MTLGPSPRPAATAAVIEATPLMLPAMNLPQQTLANQPARLATGRIQFIDAQPIRLEERGRDRLDGGQDATELELDFPAAAPKEEKSKEIHMDAIDLDVAFSDDGRSAPSTRARLEARAHRSL